MTLAYEDDNSKLVDIVTDIGAEKRVETVWCRFGSRSLVIKLNFEHKV